MGHPSYRSYYSHRSHPCSPFRAMRSMDFLLVQRRLSPLTNHFLLLTCHGASAPDLMEHLRRGVAVDQEAVHKAGFQDSFSGSQFAASAAKQDHLMFS